MWNNPIIQRELIAVLRTRKAMGALVLTACLFTALIVLRWPSDARVDLSGEQSRQVFRMFAYGLLTVLLLLTPVFPATSIIREKQRGTLVLLLNSPLRPWAIYVGKLVGCAGFTLLLLSLSLPAAAACFAMGGVSLMQDVLPLYVVLALAALQLTSLALLVSTSANSADAALRIAYAATLTVTVIFILPHYFLQGTPGWKAEAADWLRCGSPIPAVMELVGHGTVGGRGIQGSGHVVFKYCLLAAGSSFAFIVSTWLQLNDKLLDRSRSAGAITDEQELATRLWRRLFFLVDPQRRKPGIGPFTNPVMVKEFRCRRFGRMHWMLRLAAFTALISMMLTYATTMGTIDWGVQTIGGIMVLLQAAIIVLLVPSLAGGLVSSERESGGWQLLQMTPMSASKILRGKLASVAWPILLILVSTLPGYVVMVYIEPEMWLQIRQVLICLGMTSLFSISISLASSTLFQRTTVATTVAYATLVVICAGTLLIWMLREAPFGHRTVEWALAINPIAPALTAIGAPGFTGYNLLPMNWWWIGAASACLSLLVLLRLRWLMRPR